MRALLLAGVGVVAMGGAAFANGPTPNNPHTVMMDRYAVALGLNAGQVAYNGSSTSWFNSRGVSMTGSFNGRAGIANANQNAGANSLQQNTVAVAYVEGCDCEVKFSGDANANTIAANIGGVRSNHSANTLSGASASIEGSFNGGPGISQVNQNAGANSAQQNATAVAAATGVGGRFVQDRDAWAIAANAGTVTGSGNHSHDLGHVANGSISGSFNGSTGVANVNQNVGANSLQQNSVAISAIEFCNCAAFDLSTTVAVAGNLGAVTGNQASAAFGHATVSMTGSFNGGAGIANVSQNAGANSLMQNSVAVGAVYR